MPSLDTARIDIERFWSTIERSAEIGPGRPGGLSRLALSDADKEVRDTFVGWCREAGLTVRVDDATSGQVVAQLQDTDPGERGVGGRLARGGGERGRKREREEGGSGDGDGGLP